MLEQVLGTWVAPLLMIPGMALLTISTGNRYGQLLLFIEQRKVIEQQKAESTVGLQRQLSLLKRALIALYAGIGVDAVAGLLGGLLSGWPTVASTAIVGLSCLGVALLVAAISFLISDVWRSPVQIFAKE